MLDRNPIQPQIIPQIRNFPNETNNNNDFIFQNSKNGNQVPVFSVPFPINKNSPSKEVENPNNLSNIPRKEALFEIPDFSKGNYGNQPEIKNSSNSNYNFPYIINQNKFQDDYKRRFENYPKEINNEAKNSQMEDNIFKQKKSDNTKNLNPNADEQSIIQGQNIKSKDRFDAQYSNTNVPITKISLHPNSNFSNPGNSRVERSSYLSFGFNENLQIQNKAIKDPNEIKTNSILNFESECKNLGVQKCNSCNLKSKYKAIFNPCNCEVFFCNNPDCFKLIGEIEKLSNSLRKKDILLCVKCKKPFTYFAKISFFDADKFFEKKVELI